MSQIITKSLSQTCKVIWIVIAFLQWNLYDAYGREIGKPFIRNYSSKSYNAHTQNWSVIQDKRGIMYFGNTYGVLQYDGVSWRLTRVSNKSTVRSLGLDRNGRVYVGAVDEFGYLAANDQGELIYHSLVPQLDSQYHNFGDVWSTIIRDDEVFFFTRNFLFRYKDGAFTVNKLSNSYHRAFLVEEHIYVRQEGKGLFELRGNTFHLLPNTEQFASEIVSAIMHFGDQQLLIGSRKKGLFIYDKSTSSLTPIFPSLSKRLVNAQIYTGLLLENEHYAIGTLTQGVFIFDKAGKIIQKLDVHSGIQNERIYNMSIDRDGALWLTTDNGISHAEITMPLTDWDQSFGLKGTVYSILRHKDLLYAGTSDGVFALFEDDIQGGFKFVKVNNIHTQTWHLASYQTPSEQQLLLAATSDGVYEIKRFGASFQADKVALADVNTFVLLPYKPNPNKIYVGLLNGLAEIEYNNGNWKSSKRLARTSGAVRNMILDKDQNLWLGTRYSGVSKITFDAQHNFKAIEKYGIDEGLPNNHLVNLCEVDTNIIVVGPKGVASYDWAYNRFNKDPIFGDKYIQGQIGILHAIEDSRGNLWIHAIDETENKEWLEVKLKRSDNSYSLDSVTLKRLSGVEMYAIYPEANNITWIGGSDGLVRYDNTVHIDGDNPFHTLIRGVHTHEDDAIFLGEYSLSYAPSHGIIEGLLQAPPERKILNYKQNSVSFHYAAATYENETDNRYSHYLENYDPPGYWSHWKHETVNEYTNLPEGDYKFYVKARNIYDHESTIACFEFTVLPPWYRTIQAYFAYLVLAFLLIWGIVAFNIRRLKKKNRILELKVWEKTKKLQLQNHEIEEKNVELAQQKEEIAAQRDHLLESFENIKVLSSIGKELTSTLSIDGLVTNTYDQLVRLFDMSIFGLGFYKPLTNQLEFPKAMAFGEKLPLIAYDIADSTQLAVKCYVDQQEILIKNHQEYQHYEANGVTHELLAKREVNSLIYVPLTVNDKHVGVITIQHKKPDAYHEYHLNLLRNLATYIAIALDNAEAYTEIQVKNNEIQKASQEITDSINYAKRIQGAMLPKIEDIKSEFPDSFVFLKPKDIVSGDFYWYSSKRDIMGNNKYIIAAVDCTGHGVPGAFMSTIGMDLMDEIVNLMGISEADQILNYLHKLVRKSLRQKETKNHDGMDMAVCVIDKHRGKIEYAGAKNPLIMFKNGEMIEVNADRRSIGGSYWNETQDERKFTKHIINLDPNEPITCYMYTDGYQDQFGGPKRRKYMSKRFKETLARIHLNPMAQQAQELDENLSKWMDQEPQVDDVLVIGFRI